MFNFFENYEHNYSYFPILIDDEELKKTIFMHEDNFYPLISNMPSYKSLPSANKENLPVANRIAEQVLFLPIYGKLALNNVIEINKRLKEFLIR